MDYITFLRQISDNNKDINSVFMLKIQYQGNILQKNTRIIFKFILIMNTHESRVSLHAHLIESNYM